MKRQGHQPLAKKRQGEVLGTLVKAKIFAISKKRKSFISASYILAFLWKNIGYIGFYVFSLSIAKASLLANKAFREADFDILRQLY